jgi:hypothetical protein
MSEAISRRHLFAREFRPLRSAVAVAIAKADPIKFLHLGAPGDEYDQEVSSIVPFLKDAVSAEEVRAIVRAEFVRRFGEEVAGPPERYNEAAQSIWRAVQESRRGK